jgi:hypothetical protein
MGSSAATAVIESLFCAPLASAERTPLALEDRAKKEAAQLDAAKCGITRRARDEARSLFRLVGQKGQTARSIREQIYIPPRVARDLFLFVEAYPANAWEALEVIEFRNQVLREFDALAQRAEYAERIAAAEVEAERIAASEIALPLLHELVVRPGAPLPNTCFTASIP